MKDPGLSRGMASNGNGGKTPSIHHHHHHHHFFYISPHCPLHRPISQPENHSPSCSFLATQNPGPLASVQLHPQSNHLSAHPHLQNVDENEEGGDPIFVLTDEWKEFFAKSEAKRRAKKQQAKQENK